MTEESGNARDPQRLSPPTFTLPANMDDYEVWTVRLPTSLDIDLLQGIEIDTTNNASLATFQADNVDYGLTNGDASENEQFRLLLRDDDFLRPYARPFDRHVNVTAVVEETLDIELAPRLETAPTPADPVRRSYSHVPQASGLKRRWMPPGGGNVASTPTSRTKVENGKINGIKYDDDSSSALRSPSKNETPMRSTPGSAATDASKKVMTSSADDDTLASKRMKVEENGDHHSLSSVKKKSKKERKKEKKPKKDRKRAKKEHRIKSED